MPHFSLKLIAPRPSFAVDMNESEKSMMKEHLSYWKSRQDQDEVLVFGPVFDPKGPYGMGIVAADDEAAAHAIAANDPAMKAGIGFAYEIYPMRAITRDRVIS